MDGHVAMEEWKDPNPRPESLMPGVLTRAFPQDTIGGHGNDGARAGFKKHGLSVATSSPREEGRSLPMTPQFGQKLGAGSSLAERMQARAGFNVPKLSMPFGTAAGADNSVLGAPSPYLTIPPGLSPATLLESPVFLSNAMGQASPTTGKLLMLGGTNDNDPIRFEGPPLGEGTGAFSFKPLDLKSACYTAEEKKESLCNNQHPSQPSTQVSFKAETKIQTAQEANLLGQLNQQKLNGQTHLQADRHDPKLSRLAPDTAAGNENVSPPEHGQPAEEGDARGDYPAMATAAPAEDGYSWRKYGQKQVKHSEYPRSYYKCTHPNCQVKKKVERSHEGHITEIIYKGTHNHPKQAQSRRPGVPPVHPFGDAQADTADKPGSQANVGEARHPWHNNAGGQELRGDGGLDATSSPSVPGELCDSSASMQVHDGARFESPEGVGVTSAVSDEVNGDDRVTHGSMSQGGADAEGDELESKRRKLESYAIDMSSASRAVREPRVVIQTTSEVDILDDGYRWRKYGQKVVKGNPNPRSYYKCTHPGCSVRKHVERASHDLKSVITTYEGKHNHEVPAARNSGHPSSAAVPGVAAPGLGSRRPEHASVHDGLMRLGGCGAPFGGLPPRDPLAPMGNYPYSSALGAASLPSLPTQIQMQQMLLQRAAQQQQRRDGSQLLNGAASGFSGSDPLMRQNPATANSMAAKMYEERLKLPSQRDSLDEASMKQRYGENAGQVIDPSQASLLKAAASGQSSGQVLHGTAGDLSSTPQQVQTRSPQQPMAEQNIKTEMNPVLTTRAAGSEGSLIGLQGSNQTGNNLTLKGWPLTGLDQLRSGILQQKSFMQSPQQFQQQQLLLHAQQNMPSSISSDVDSRRLRMLLNNRNVVPGQDGQTNNGGDVIPNIGSPGQSGGPRTDIDMLIKKKLAFIQQQQQLQQHNYSQQQQQQLQQPALSGQQSQSSNQLLHQHGKSAVGSMPIDGSMPNSFGFPDQASKKRKKPVSSSGRANSSGTANTAGPSPSSAPSTPSTHTPGDAMSMPQLQCNGGPSKPLMIFGSDGTGSLTSPANALLQGDVDRLLEDGSLDENVESFLSQDDMDPRDTMERCLDSSKGLGFIEVAKARASTSKVVCCHFSLDGKLLATGGHDKKVVLWFTDVLKPKSILEEHSLLITDVRFSTSMTRLATSSFDKTVRVWDADNPDFSLRTFTGHSASVMSHDFHPNKEDIICSCDSDGEVRCWSITNGSCVTCVRVFNGGATQLRFQPRQGKYLAAASEKVISILDAETLQVCRTALQGHIHIIQSVCWDATGNYLASVSEDSVRVWSFTSGNDVECVHELNCSGNKFHSCVFHPSYPSLLIIGCYESLELWDIREKNTMTISNAHDGLIAALSVSNASGLVASVSHDKLVKLWK